MLPDDSRNASNSRERGVRVLHYGFGLAGLMMAQVDEERKALEVDP
jgi:hypothetical protein